MHGQSHAGLDAVGHVVVHLGLVRSRDAGLVGFVEQADTRRQVGVDDLFVDLLVRRAGCALRGRGRRLGVDRNTEVFRIVVVGAGVELGQHVVAERTQRVGLSEDELALVCCREQFGRSDQAVARVDGRIVAVPLRVALQTRVVVPVLHVVGEGLPHPAAACSREDVVLTERIGREVARRDAEAHARAHAVGPGPGTQTRKGSGQCRRGVFDVSIDDVGLHRVRGKCFECVLRAGEREGGDDAQH